MKIEHILFRGLLTFGLLLGLLNAAPILAQTTIKIGHTDNQRPFDSPHAAMSVVFKGVLERESLGQVKVNIFPSSQLGKEREMMEALQLGSIRAVIITEGTTVNFFAPMGVLGIPFLYPSIDVAWKVMDGPFGQNLKEVMRKETGLRIVATAAPGPFRNFGTKKPVRKLEDLKGVRIRTMQHPGHQAMVKALGAAPTPLPFGEVYSAIKTGVVDGLELPYQAILNMKLDEVIDHVIVDGHLFNQTFFFVNDKWFSSLPPDHQAAVLRAGKAAQAAGRGLVQVWESVGADELSAKGVELYFPTAEQHRQFRNLAQPAVMSMLREEVDKKWIDGILKAVEEASTK
jgi:C4-dicarboxylate-binding protein DctP